MQDAAAQGKVLLDHIKLELSSVKPIQRSVNTSATGINYIMSVSDIWGQLLDQEYT
jgi:hypothetical protein